MFQTIISAIKILPNIAFLSWCISLYFSGSEHNPLKSTEQLSDTVSPVQQPGS